MPYNRISFYSFACLILFLAPSFLFAQIPDSSKNTNDSLKIYYTCENGFEIKNFEKNFKEIDTSLSGFQKMENFFHGHPYYAVTSSVGAAERSLLFESGYEFGQISSHKYFSQYLFNNTNAKYYNSLTPYTNAFYMMGPKREQIFDLVFARNFGNLLNIAVDYYLLYTPGQYARKKSNDNFVSITSNYHSRNKKYLALTNYFYNRLNIEENGGLEYDTVFTENLQPNRSLMGVNLQSANTRVKENGIYLKQLYFPGFNRGASDTIKGNEEYKSFGRFSHSLLIKNIKEAYLDSDPASGFYQNVFLDSVSTHDSIQVNILENIISWSNAKYNISDSVQQHFLINLGARHLFQHIYGINWDFTAGSIIPQVSCSFNTSSFQLYFSGFYTVGGYNVSDYSLSAGAYYFLDEARIKSISVGTEMISQTPAWFDRNYFSNHFSWLRDFEKTNTSKTSLQYNSNDFSAQLNFFNIQNPVYFDTSALPEQLQGSSRVVQMEFKKNFKWRKWNLENEMVFQKVGGTEVIRLPEFVSNHSLYFSDKLIKNVLSAQLGLELTFFSSYYPQAYMPATRQFFQQNTYKSASYPYVDFFINLKIKRLRVFLKFDHLNSGLMGYNYFMIPNYPMSDRGIKFGLSWTFYN